MIIRRTARITAAGVVRAMLHCLRWTNSSSLEGQMNLDT
jgi:hypothetical protein